MKQISRNEVKMLKNFKQNLNNLWGKSGGMKLQKNQKIAKQISRDKV